MNETQTLIAEIEEARRGIDDTIARLRVESGDTGPRAVTANFGADGVLAGLEIDTRLRRVLTEDQLISQIEETLLAGPSPVAAIPRDLGALDELAPASFTSPDKRLTVRSVLGKITGVQAAGSGWIAYESSAELASRIVLLARTAADHAIMEARR